MPLHRITPTIAKKYPHLAEIYQGLRLKTCKIHTNIGEIEANEINSFADQLTFGVHIGKDSIVGNVIYWHLPTFTNLGTTQLKWCLTNIHSYHQYREQYQRLIANSDVVKWHLIFLLMCGASVKNSIPMFENMTQWATPELLDNQELFLNLINDGAQFQHYLHNAYHAIAPEDMANYFEIFDHQCVVSERKELHLLSSALVDSDLIKANMALMADCDINGRIDDFDNTTLHYLLALEHEAKAIEFLDLLNQRHKLSLLDLRAQDIYGKTPLLMAVAMNLNKVVSYLLSLQRQGKDIGMNMPDHQGRTPLMISAALGYTESFKALHTHQADLSLRDQQGHDLSWYASAPLSAIQEILRSLTIHPDRPTTLHWSHLYSESRGNIPWVLVDKQGQEQLLLLSVGDAPGQELLEFALDLAPAEDKAFIKDQIDNLKASSYSLSQQCKKNQSITYHNVGQQPALMFHNQNPTQGQHNESKLNEQLSNMTVSHPVMDKK